MSSSAGDGSFPLIGVDRNDNMAMYTSLPLRLALLNVNLIVRMARSAIPLDMGYRGELVTCSMPRGGLWLLGASGWNYERGPISNEVEGGKRIFC